MNKDPKDISTTGRKIGRDKSEEGAGNHAISRAAVVWLGVALLASCVVVFSGKNIIPVVASLYPNLLPANPYLIFEYAGLLYLVTPVVVISSILLFFFPGFFLVLATGSRYRWADTFLRAFGAALIFYFLVITVVKLLTPNYPGSNVFLFSISGAGMLLWASLAWRVYRGVELSWPLATREDRRRLIWTLLIPVIALLALLPLIFWQDLHDDGSEALEIGRSLGAFLFPRFPTPSGVMGIGIGLLPMAYPVHWFVELFGPLEAAARFPILVYLPVLYCLLLLLAEHCAPRRLNSIEEGMVLLALGVYTVTMSYNASYDPYFSDIAAPAALETLTIVFILAAIYFLWSESYYWFFVFSLLSYLGRPTGLLILGFLAISVFITLPEKRKAWLPGIFGAAGLCLLVAYGYDHYYVPSQVGDTSVGYPFSSTIERLQYIRLDDFSRFGFLLFPAGILPALSLFLYYKQDPLARSLTVLSIAYFAFFYVQAFVGLHHFVPAMILPIVVFWRLYLYNSLGSHRIVLPAVAVAAVLALWLSLPQHYEINRTARAIGERTALLVGDYKTDYYSQVGCYELFYTLVPPDWEVEEPSRELVSGYSSLIYYATRPKPPGTEINYVIQPLDKSAPDGFTAVDENDVAVLYVRDLDQWHRDRKKSQMTNYRSVLYDIPRETLFAHWGIPSGSYDADLFAFACHNPLLSSVTRATFGEFCSPPDPGKDD